MTLLSCVGMTGMHVQLLLHTENTCYKTARCTSFCKAELIIINKGISVKKFQRKRVCCILVFVKHCLPGPSPVSGWCPVSSAPYWAASSLLHPSLLITPLCHRVCSSKERQRWAQVTKYTGLCPDLPGVLLSDTLMGSLRSC